MKEAKPDKGEWKQLGKEGISLQVHGSHVGLGGWGHTQWTFSHTCSFIFLSLQLFESVSVGVGAQGTPPPIPPLGGPKQLHLVFFIELTLNPP